AGTDDVGPKERLRCRAARAAVVMSSNCHASRCESFTNRGPPMIDRAGMPRRMLALVAATALWPAVQGVPPPPLSGSPRVSLSFAAFETQKGVRVTRSSFGKTPAGVETHLFTMTNGAGASLRVTDYGARIVAVNVPDRAGKLANVTLGFDSLAGYL